MMSVVEKPIFGPNWWLLMLPLFRLSSYEPYEPLANRISFMLRFTGFVNMIRLIMPTNREKTWEHLWIFNYILHCPLNVKICNWIFLKCQSSTVANLAIISSWPILATGRKCSFERLPYLLLNYFLIWQELDLFSEKFFQIDEDREDPAPGMQMPSERASQPNEGNGGVKNLGTAKSASYENSTLCQLQMECLQQRNKTKSLVKMLIWLTLNLKLKRQA